MALVKCPECGKMVSDSAEACPDCGYAVKKHFDNIRIQEEKKKLEEQKAAQRIKEQEKQQKRIEQVANSKVVPKRRPIIHWLMVAGAIDFILAVLVIVVSEQNYAEDTPWGTALVIMAIGILVFLVGLAKLKESQDLYDKYKDNEAEYKKEMARLQIEEEDRIEAVREQRKQEKVEKKQARATLPSCPVCGSNHVKRISTTNRAVSVYVAGVASSKIGKQYQCQDCKHLW